MSDRPSSGGGGDMAGLIGLLLLGAGIAVWYLVRYIAWAVLFLARDLVVYIGGTYFGDYAARAAIVCWRLVVPILMAGAGFGLVYGQLAQPNRYVPWVINLPVSLSLAGLLLYHYYNLYREKLPKHYAWARFAAADVLVRSELKLAWIEETFKWRL